MTVKGLLASKESFVCIVLFWFSVPDCGDSQVLHIYSVSEGEQCHRRTGNVSLMEKSLGFISWPVNGHELLFL